MRLEIASTLRTLDQIWGRRTTQAAPGILNSILNVSPHSEELLSEKVLHLSNTNKYICVSLINYDQSPPPYMFSILSRPDATWHADIHDGEHKRQRLFKTFVSSLEYITETFFHIEDNKGLLLRVAFEFFSPTYNITTVSMLRQFYSPCQKMFVFYFPSFC